VVLKEKIKDCASKSLEKIFVQLPNIFQATLEEYLVNANEVSYSLNWTIHENSANFVEYFVNYCNSMEKAERFDKSYEDHIFKLSSLLQLIIKSKIKVPEVFK